MSDESSSLPASSAPTAAASTAPSKAAPSNVAPAELGGITLPSWMPRLDRFSLMALIGVDAMWGMAEMAMVSTGIVELMTGFGAPIAVAQAVVMMGGMALAGVITGTIITINQQRRGGDEPKIALAKGAMLGVVAAVPSPLLGGTVTLGYLARSAFSHYFATPEPAVGALDDAGGSTGALPDGDAPALATPPKQLAMDDDDAIDVAMEEVKPSE